MAVVNGNSVGRMKRLELGRVHAQLVRERVH